MVEDHERVREQRLCARPAGARRITAVVKRDDISMRKQCVQGEGRSLGVPGISAEAQQRWRALSPLYLRGDSHAREAFAIRRHERECCVDAGSRTRAAPASIVGNRSQVWAKYIPVMMTA